MDIKRAISIINGDIIANTEESLDAYKTFFSSLGVDIQNTDN